MIGEEGQAPGSPGKPCRCCQLLGWCKSNPRSTGHAPVSLLPRATRLRSQSRCPRASPGAAFRGAACFHLEFSHPGGERLSGVLCQCCRSARTEAGEQESPLASITRASGPSGRLAGSSEPRSSFLCSEEVNPCFVVFRYSVCSSVLSTSSQRTCLFFLLLFSHFPCPIHSLEVMKNPGLHSVCFGAAFWVRVCVCMCARAHTCVAYSKPSAFSLFSAVLFFFLVGGS